MTKNEKKELKDEIKELRKLNIEQNFLIFKYLMEAYVNSIITFGINNKVTKETFDLFKKYRKITRREDNIYSYLLEKSKLIDLGESLELIDSLDELNSKTINYFYSSIDNILDACISGEEIRAKYNKRTFKTLDETDEFEFQTKGLLIDFNFIKNYLNYPEVFWNFIDNKMLLIDSHNEESSDFYKLLMKFDDDNNLQDIKVIVPCIINVQTARINIHEIECAYELYKLFGKKIEEKNIYECINNEGEKFKQYVIDKIK